MSAKNPYTLVFGHEPQSLIERHYQNEEILNDFLDDNPTYRVCMITGVRGCGKTVALTSLSNNLSKDSNWITINLNPERDLLIGLAAELSYRRELHHIFKDAKINISIFGFGIEMDNVPPISDVSVVLKDMLKQLTRKGKKVLVAIDEVRPNKNIREFVSQFQIFIREKIDIYLLMSGLYNQITNLQNTDSLTFLQRAPKISLEPLNISSMKNSYKKNLNINDEKAIEMAKFTKGYAFAFQLLGYICWKNNCSLKNAIDEFDELIEDYSYNKIWSGCSETDKKFLSILSNEPTKLEVLKKKLKMSNGSISTYRLRMIKAGIIYSPTHGLVDFALPRFKEYIDRVK